MIKTFLIIDTFNFLHRAYHALPKTFTNLQGEPVNAVYGVSSMLLNVLENIKPDYIVSALDSKEPNFRLEQLVTYKAHRKPMDNELSTQIPKIINLIEAFGIKNIVISGYEADDIIGTLIKKFYDKVHFLVISNDRDLWQLTNYGVKIMIPNKKGDFNYINSQTAKEIFELEPEQIVDYKGLRGDPSDNIPGVFGIGDITAKNLLKKFNTIEQIYQNIEQVTSDSLRKKLIENYEQALLSKKIATIDTNAPLTISLQECAYLPFEKNKIKLLFEEYNFKSLIKRIGFDLTFNSDSTPSSNISQLNLF